ncbi:MAG: hypothetical protein DI536_01545 [Archangium gephyra]|uniref:Uncharacterized protein n=1 Tax=Archangium gephyra TaxID=48 RepID=A0A2W5TVY1_9BACT|nr:MAG: hypothetical protein DI536_01545 [Archangium gephyra]
MTNTCVACASDMSCTTPTTPACQMSGACAECSATNATVCAGNKPVCVTSMGFCGCNADGDCGDATSGRLCEGAVCQGGCALGRNDCAADQWCDVRDGGIGACIEQCASDSDCTAQLTHCDVGAVPAFCVECTNDAQCAAGSVCSPTTKTCVECTATNTSSCSATMNGAACLVSNTCGCVSDVDCGDVNSGRICDATTSKCTVGCSATGNGCPAMQTCSSGTCVTIVVDAGVGVDAGVEIDAGVEVDAGVMSDAGMPTGGRSGAGGAGGSMMMEEPMGGGGEAPSAPTGCGCTSVDPSLLIAALGLLLTRRSSR